MKLKKIGWVIFSCMVVAGIALASCGPATDEEEEEEGTATDEPQYGGELTYCEPVDTRSFDDIYPWAVSTTTGIWSVLHTNTPICDGGWERGPAGTNEVGFMLVSGWEGQDRLECCGGIAEQWEMDGETNSYIFHIRKGAYYSLNPDSEASKLVGGRELVADDVVYCINRQWTVDSFIKTARPAPISVTAPDDNTVIVEFDSFTNMTLAQRVLTNLIYIFPPEVIEKYGDMSDWRNSVGTGPFILTDYVKGSTITLERNPNYWGKYPVPGPIYGKQLPFLDTVKILIVPDVSSQMAGLRTGKIDRVKCSWEDARSLRQTNPELMQKGYITTAIGCLHMRQDDPSLPWANQTVRQAMHMSIDYRTVAEDFYGGEGAWYALPVLPVSECKDMFVPFEDLPQNVQDLFDYNPEKAKQMLADAGYADGFDIEVVCTSPMVDVLSIYKDYWAKIGINVIIDQKESAVWTSQRTSKSFKDSIIGSVYANQPFNMDLFTDNRNNGSCIVDPFLADKKIEIFENFLDWEKRCELYKGIVPYMLEKCYYIPFPAYKSYTVWQPWIGGYHGEYGTRCSTEGSFARFVWIDQELKAEMTGGE